jgi:hypothetical protein
MALETLLPKLMVYTTNLVQDMWQRQCRDTAKPEVDTITGLYYNTAPRVLWLRLHAEVGLCGFRDIFDPH